MSLPTTWPLDCGGLDDASLMSAWRFLRIKVSALESFSLNTIFWSILRDSTGDGFAVTQVLGSLRLSALLEALLGGGDSVP